LTYFNNQFRFVFSPNEQNWYTIHLNKPFNKRFLIGAGQISNYVNEKNAETVLKTAEKMKTDKCTIKFRKYGKIEIYVK